MILESERRWNDWQGGQPIELPDGQTWWFCAPEAQVRDGLPIWSFGPGTPHDLNVGLSTAFRRILRKWTRATNDDDRAAATLEAAWFLLARNYQVSPEEFEGILAGLDNRTQGEQGSLMADFLMLVGGTCARATALVEMH